MKHEDIVLGQKYRWTRHEYTGIANARIEYLTGCWQVELERARLDKEGQHIVQGRWIDVGEIAEIGKAPNAKENTFAPKGGPQNGPCNL